MSGVVDASYDGETFDIALADIPGRKADVVEGSYEVEVPDDAAAVAVRITDMLGEEILVVLPVRRDA